MPSSNTSTSEVSTEKGNEVQYSVLQQALPHHPKGIGRWKFVSWITAVRLRLTPATPWVALLGVDGSGKSSVLQELEKLFSPPLFAGVQVIYKHPGLFYGRLLYPSRHSSNSGDERTVIDHYAKPPHGMVQSIAKLGFLALDWLVGYWSQIVIQRAKGYLVLFDRHYFLDVSVDPLRSRYGGPPWLARLIGQLLPGPDLIILLDAPIEVLQNRKQEVSSEEAVRQQLAYLELVQELPNSYVIDVSKPLEQVVHEAQQIILDYTIARPTGKLRSEEKV